MDNPSAKPFVPGSRPSYIGCRQGFHRFRVMRHKREGDDYVLICKICGEVDTKAFEMDSSGRIKQFYSIKQSKRIDKSTNDS